jgi:hypothetical protein
MKLSDNPQAFKDAGDYAPIGGYADDDDPPEMVEAQAEEMRWRQDRQERADLVREVQDQLFQAIEKVEDAVRGTEIEDNIDAYVIAHLKILASGDHGYVSRDTSLDDVVRMLLGRDEDEDEDW